MARDLETAAGIFRARGAHIELAPTTAPGSAPEQAQQAVLAGCDAVLACGGDGTMHEVLQGLMEAPSGAALGLIPLGTHNVLAHDLRLPRGIVPAARALAQGTRRTVAVGSIEFALPAGGRGRRHFLATAGVGCDAHALYHISPLWKRRLGIFAYYGQALRSFLTHSFQPFEVEYRSPVGETRRRLVSQVLAVRIAYFGGVLRRLAPGASLDSDHLRLVLFHSGGRMAYVRYVLGVVLGRQWKIPGVELASAVALKCQPLPGSPDGIYAEADGEYLGRLPVAISMASRRLEVLVPAPRGVFAETQPT